MKNQIKSGIIGLAGLVMSLTGCSKAVKFPGGYKVENQKAVDDLKEAVNYKAMWAKGPENNLYCLALDPEPEKWKRILKKVDVNGDKNISSDEANTCKLEAMEWWNKTYFQGNGHVPFSEELYGN